MIFKFRQGRGTIVDSQSPSGTEPTTPSPIPGVAAYSLIALVMAFAICTVMTAHPSLAVGEASAAAPAPGPTVLIVIDTLRADHLPCYGYGYPTANEICRLAEEGVVFERAFSPKTETSPSIASMLTGLEPHRHGVEDLYWLLPTHHQTLADQFSAAGYSTGAFTSSFVMVHSFSGFDQGFDVYDDALTREEPFRENFERGAEQTIDSALQWLEDKGPNTFLFVHLIEPHGPYTPDASRARQFDRPDEGPVPEKGGLPEYQRIPGLEYRSQYLGRYDGEIATVDQEVGRLLRGLRDRGLYESATIVITADHGESFGEEGRWMRHSDSVNDPESWIPMVVKFRSGTADSLRGHRSPVPVALVDIYTTLLGEAGLENDVPHTSSRNLRSVASGLQIDEAPPITSHKSRENSTWQIAVHGRRCTARWLLPVGSSRIADQDEATQKDEQRTTDQKGGGLFDFLGLGGSRNEQESSWSAEQALGWYESTTREDPGEHAGSPECEAALALEAGAAIADLLSYRRDFEVTLRTVPKDGSRRKFVDDRSDPLVPLEPSEIDLLRSLGYVESDEDEEPAR